jgi:hypothetical protein
MEIKIEIDIFIKTYNTDLKKIQLLKILAQKN